MKLIKQIILEHYCKKKVKQKYCHLFAKPNSTNYFNMHKLYYYYCSKKTIFHYFIIKNTEN